MAQVRRTGDPSKGVFSSKRRFQAQAGIEGAGVEEADLEGAG
jgi:hypothetical protein